MTECEQTTVDAIAGIRRQEYARGVADAIARVVADLRRMSRTWLGPDAAADRALAMRLADRYERGEHEGAIPGILIFGFPPVNP